MKTLLLLLLLVPMMSFGQNVNIPDTNFKNYLVNNPSINTNSDGEIQVSEASAFTGWINVHNKDISDLTGIEEFTSLIYLYCYDNQLTSLDVSSCSALTYLYCNDNQLTRLDIRNGNNTNFYNFNCTNNPNLTCISVDDPTWSTANWTNIDSQSYFSSNCNPSAIQEQTTNKKILKITDLLGREKKQTNHPLLYLYDDGTVEKRIVIE